MIHLADREWHQFEDSDHVFLIYLFISLAGVELSLGASVLTAVISYLTWHTFVPLQAKMCLTIRVTCGEIFFFFFFFCKCELMPTKTYTLGSSWRCGDFMFSD